MNVLILQNVSWLHIMCQIVSTSGTTNENMERSKKMDTQHFGEIIVYCVNISCIHILTEERCGRVMSVYSYI